MLFYSRVIPFAGVLLALHITLGRPENVLGGAEEFEGGSGVRETDQTGDFVIQVERCNFRVDAIQVLGRPEIVLAVFDLRTCGFDTLVLHDVDEI